MNNSRNFDRLSMLRARRMDDVERYSLKASAANEVYDRIADRSISVKYAIGTMQPIDPAYTKHTIAEAERVRGQLASHLPTYGITCEYEYQGSVTNDTHIKSKSDIDLLTLHSAFVVLDPPQRVTTPYKGDALADLKKLRMASVSILRNKFPAATVDDTGAKSVSVEGGSLARKVDVVASNWCDTCEYARTQQKKDRAVNVLDVKKSERLRNLPFLHNDRIQTKDMASGGGLRKAIRLMKSLKYDSRQGVSLSSYDIASIAYNMPSSRLNVSRGEDLFIVQYCKEYVDALANSQVLRDTFEVPNGTRKIFCSEGASLAQLKELQRELDSLVSEIESDLHKSWRNIKEARVLY